MKEKDKGWEPLLCGGVAGLINRFFISPLDVVKIRLQLQAADTRRSTSTPTLTLTPTHTPTSASATVTAGGGVASGRLYNGAWHAFKTILKTEGVRGLWKGNVSAEWLYVTYSAAQFWSYGQISHAFDLLVVGVPDPNTASAAGGGGSGGGGGGREGVPKWLKPFVAGAGAGAFATTVTYPFDFLRTRFAAASGNAPLSHDSSLATPGGDGKVGRRSAGIVAVVRDVVQRDGIKGLYRGLTPSVAQVVPYMGLLFGTYEPLRRFLHIWLNPRIEALADDLLPTTNAEDLLPPTDASPVSAPGTSSERSAEAARQRELRRYFVGWDTALAGVIAGLLSKTGTFPLDVARKRLQVQGHGLDSVYVFKDIPVYSGITTTNPAEAAASAEVAAAAGGAGAQRGRVSLAGYLRRSTTIGCITQIVRQEGVRGLYKGLGVSLVKSAPSSAITLFTFEQTARLLRRLRSEGERGMEGEKVKVEVPAA